MAWSYRPWGGDARRESVTAMIESVAFITYPVSDIARSRRFYEGVLGLKLTHEAFDAWFEYDLAEVYKLFPGFLEFSS
jgi:predicted enzyme related to lactoylglutathione lyase